jgi:hypothetical protein
MRATSTNRFITGFAGLVLLAAVSSCADGDDADAVDTPSSRDVSSASLPTATAPSSPDLIGTWDYPLDQTQTELVVDNFAGLVDSAETVVVRVGFDGSEYWQGFLFDGELFLLDGVPEGDGGTYNVDGDKIIATGAHGEIRATFTWDIDADGLTLTWIEQCLLTSQSDDCMSDRSRLQKEDPFTLLVWEHTFTRSGDDPSY